MRKRISSNIRWARFLILGIFILLTSLLVKFLFKDRIEIESLIGLSVSSIICIVMYFAFDNAKIVEFDSNHMYITSKKGEDKIPLRNIYCIKLTSLKINNRNMWKIKYTYRNHTEDSVRILPRLFNNHFEEFKKIAAQENKDIQIQDWTIF